MPKSPREVLLYGAAGLFIYMPFHVFLSQWLSLYTGGLDIWKVAKDGITIVVTILCIAYVYWKKRSTSLYNKLLLLVVAYGLLHLLLMFATNQPYETGFLAILYNLRIFAYLIIGFSLALMFPKRNLLPLFFRYLIIVSTIVCAVALLQRLLPSDILTHFGYSVDRGVKPNFFIDDKPDFPRVFGTLRDPNSFGAFLILPIVLLASRLWQNWQTEKRLMYGGLFLLHVLVLFLTFSRSTLLATILALVVLVVITNQNFVKQNKKKIALFALGFLIVLGGLIGLTRDSYVTQNVVLHADESTVLEDPNELRVGFLKKAIDAITERPLGHGPGTAGLVATRSPVGGLMTENYYLQIAYEVGIVGLLVFIAVLVTVFRRLFRSNKAEKKIMLASGVGVLFACLFFHTLSNEAVAIAWLLPAGLILKSRE